MKAASPQFTSTLHWLLETVETVCRIVHRVLPYVVRAGLECAGVAAWQDLQFLPLEARPAQQTHLVCWGGVDI